MDQNAENLSPSLYLSTLLPSLLSLNLSLTFPPSLQRRLGLHMQVQLRNTDFFLAEQTIYLHKPQQQLKFMSNA